jgi:hypothetical protein
MTYRSAVLLQRPFFFLPFLGGTAGDITINNPDIHFQEYDVPINVTGAMRVRAGERGGSALLSVAVCCELVVDCWLLWCL